MLAEKPVAGEKITREEYVKAKVALTIIISLAAAIALPLLGLVLGISVKIFRLISGI